MTKIFAQMFDDIAENTDINYSDQLYLEHHGNGAILRRLHTAQGLDMASINVKLTNQETDLETFDVELYGDEDLKQYMAAFFDEPRKMKDWYNLVRSYSIVGMKEGEAEEEIDLTVKQLLSSKYRAHSGHPEEEKIDGTSVWIPVEELPDISGLSAFSYSGMTINDTKISRAMKSLIKDAIPEIGTSKAYAGQADKNFHFRNSDDGQGLVLSHINSDPNGVIGSYPVPGQGKDPITGGPPPIVVTWAELKDRIIEQHGKLEKPIGVLDLLAPLAP